MWHVSAAKEKHLQHLPAIIWQAETSQQLQYIKLKFTDPYSQQITTVMSATPCVIM